MREILFRGKNKDKWIVGYYRKTKVVGGYNHLIYAIERFDEVYNPGKVVDPHTLGQYTGLKDYNGKMIFEGDIVKFEDAVADCEGYHDNVFSNRSAIEYIDGSFTVCGTDVVTMSDLVYKGKFDGEVIGNIHDNPDLMEGVTQAKPNTYLELTT